MPQSQQRCVITGLDHLRKLTTTRLRTEARLSFLLAHFNNKITESEGLDTIATLRQSGHLSIDDKGKVSYDLRPGKTAFPSIPPEQMVNAFQDRLCALRVSFFIIHQV